MKTPDQFLRQEDLYIVRITPFINTQLEASDLGSPPK
jgi:hypothetical protein